MITKEQIKALVLEAIAGSDQFLVDVKVSTANKIIVLIDAHNGVGIDDCVKVSRFIESSLDREKEDFELEVGSAGLDSPFVVLEQYQKYLGKEVKVITEEGKKVQGILADVNEEGVVIKYEEKQRVEGKKKKVTVEIEKQLFFKGELKESNIKSTKIVISFK